MHVKEMTVRYRLRRVRAVVPKPAGHLAKPAEAAGILIPILGTEIVEVCGVLCLSTRLELLTYHELSRGTLDSTIVHPRDVFRAALLSNAASVIVAHYVARHIMAIMCR